MTDLTHMADRPATGNRRTAFMLALLVAAMVGMSFAAVPLYSLFCQVTGYGGTTQRAEDNLAGIIGREMGVRFDATISSGLPVIVRPAAEVYDPIGTKRTITYRATNPTARTVTMTASFNVTPELAGVYFNKIECFCFTEQTLKPGESVDMPVTFFVHPDLDKNKDLDTVREITLSYTFYTVENGGN